LLTAATVPGPLARMAVCNDVMVLPSAAELPPMVTLMAPPLALTSCTPLPKSLIVLDWIIKPDDPPAL